MRKITTPLIPSRSAWLSPALLLALTACGGGGSQTPTPAPTSTPAAITLTGVVAKGAALAGAAVTAKCASGTGTATANSTGSYTFTITGGALPCVLQAVAVDNSLTLHSVATGTGASATSNITPVTELLVAQLVGSQPATFFGEIGTVAALATSVTDTKVAAAQTAVVATLQAAGLNTTAVTNLLTQPLVPAVGNTAGDGYDQILDALAATLKTAGTSLADLTKAVAQSSSNSTTPSGSTATVANNVASLPAELLLKPQASNCAALRSTAYRFIKMAPSSSGSTVTAVETINIDAATLTLTNADNVSDTFSWAGSVNGNCRYTTPNGVDIVVSPSGILVARALIGMDDGSVAVSARGSYRMVIGLPVQNISVAEMAGQWNALTWEYDQINTFFATAGTFEVSTDGNITRARCFDDALFTAESACTAVTTPLPRLSAINGGGFTFASTNPADIWTDRAFAYRAGNGDLMLVSLSPGGGAFLATKYRTLGVPAVGETSSSWNVTTNAQGLVTNVLSSSVNVTLTVDSATGQATRNNTQDGLNNTHVQTVVRNAPRPGYIRRLAATNVPRSDGGTTNVREFVGLPLRGMGMTAVSVPNTNATGTSNNGTFILSVDK